MDFPTAPGIQKSLSDAVAHGIYGYSEGKDDYFQAAAGWYEKHFGWKVEKEWLIKTPGVVFALAMAVKAYTKEGDAVLLQQPVYYPFSEVITDNHRRLINIFFFKQKTAYEMLRSLVGSEMCIRDRANGYRFIERQYHDVFLPVSYTHLTLPTKA